MDEQQNPQAKPAGAPEPEPIRWFGTSWAERGSGYWARRVVVPLGALVAVAAGLLLLRFAVEGVRDSEAGGFVYGLLVAAIALCSLLSGLRMWKLLSEGKPALTGWMTEEKSLGAVWLIGFAGALIAYFLRSLTEAPGEAVKRAGYDRAVLDFERRQNGRTARSGNPKRAKKRR
ncbi:MULTISPECIES: hypothetical protein [unclassified Kitasatospora]|uniref:hypothetical protein n=1 Tax=unclassified Kitasatospora TaxID=2633591 RepID=UPI00070F55A8|nr:MULTISPECIES: hypothetical protein [unclassified Kitasatospora]KQV18662.1 hypothetical protein ASC99_05465 [Kitasatospora sp. Root107]KRB74644.1 hypothetical protein ASE03_19400 [Kitasatospora sp. Root187]